MTPAPPEREEGRKPSDAKKEMANEGNGESFYFGHPSTTATIAPAAPMTAAKSVSQEIQSSRQTRLRSAVL